MAILRRCIWLTFTLLATANGDPCYTSINIDEPQRSIKYHIDPSTHNLTLLCDDNLSGYKWYRFISGAGGQMTNNSEIEEYSCGTRYPWYMVGDHPSEINETIQTFACADFFNIPCFEGQPMMVKKCDGYYVYRLKSVPCPSAYCAGTELRCEDGKHSPNGFTPGCTDSFPKISDYPTINVEVVKQGYAGSQDQYLTPIMKCIFHSDGHDVYQSLFNVSWFVDNELVWTDTLDDTMGNQGKYTSTLNKFKHPVASPDDGLYSMGQNFRCSVVSAFATGTHTSPERVSKEFFAGIKIHNTSVNIKENGNPVKIAFSSSVPIICDVGDQCKVEVGLDVDMKIWEKTSRINFMNCVLEFSNSYKVDTLQYLRIISEPTQEDYDSDTYVLDFKLNTQNGSSYFNNYKVGHALVHRKGTKTSLCWSIGDPHFRTFDERFFDWYGTGDYVMVREIPKQNQTISNFEVNVRLKECLRSDTSTPSCNCAVAVREGNDVAIADRCNTTHGFKYTRQSVPGDCNPGFNITISPCGRELRVSTSSGQLVRIAEYNDFFSVHVELNGAMFDRVEGLCGNFDGDKDNDFIYFDKETSKSVKDICKPVNGGYGCIPEKFSKSYKIDKGTSLFYTDKLNASDEHRMGKYHPLCQCLPKDDKHPGGGGIYCQETFATPMNKYTKDGIPQYECPAMRTKRSFQNTQYSDDDVYDPYAYEIPEQDVVFTPENNTWPTASGITEDDARQRCTEAVYQSNIAVACQVVESSKEATDVAIDDCVFDILIMDDLTVVDIARSAVESVCVSTFSKNASLWEMNEDGDLAPPSSVINAVCPNNCNGNGNCTVNGMCLCYQGYTSIDCSIETGKPPEVEAVRSGSRCDVRKRPCERITIAATGVMNSENLTCHIHELQYETSNSTWVDTGSITKTAAEFASAYSVYCFLPMPRVRRQVRSIDEIGESIQAIKISISNDGVIQSNPAFVVMYDSLCFNCSDEGTCVRESNACLINGKCYAANEKSPFDSCQHCHLETSTDKWTEITDGPCSPTTIVSSTVNTPKPIIEGKQATWMLVIAITVPSIILIAIAVVVIVLVKRHKSSAKKSGDQPLQDFDNPGMLPHGITSYDVQDSPSVKDSKPN